MITELKAQLELTSSIERTNSHCYFYFRHLVFLLGETEKAVNCHQVPNLGRFCPVEQDDSASSLVLRSLWALLKR